MEELDLHSHPNLHNDETLIIFKGVSSVWKTLSEQVSKRLNVDFLALHSM